MSDVSAVEVGTPLGSFEDALTEVLRSGARQLLEQAVEDEVATFLAAHRELIDEQGRRRLVRNGRLPERTVQTGVGAVTVQVPRVRDRDVAGGEPIRFTSKILPPYLRRTRSLEELMPWLYLKGISTGGFGEALSALLGPNAPGLSAATIARLKEVWKTDLAGWQGRDLTGKRYVYFWADGVYFNVRMEEARQCILVVIGATADGRKELVGLSDGYREGEQSWRELLLDLKRRGLALGPKLAVGDGALGFWSALPQVYGETRQQRCWVHKAANVLNYLPKGVQPKANGHLREIWMAETKAQAQKAFDYFLEAYDAKYPKATACLAKDREALLTFYDFPAEHWAHLRTTNPIESTFATVRLRTDKTKGCLSRGTVLTMVFRLAMSAEKTWRRLCGSQRLAEVVQGVKFNNGIREERTAA